MMYEQSQNNVFRFPNSCNRTEKFSVTICSYKRYKILFYYFKNNSTLSSTRFVIFSVCSCWETVQKSCKNLSNGCRWQILINLTKLMCQLCGVRCKCGLIIWLWDDSDIGYFRQGCKAYIKRATLRFVLRCIYCFWCNTILSCYSIQFYS